MDRQQLNALEDEEWYYRDKSQDEGPLLAWCATWPEGVREGQQRANFICRLYFTAPDYEAAQHEFWRWARTRMQDVPYMVLEQLPPAETPRCLRPRPNSEGPGQSDLECWL